MSAVIYNRISSDPTGKAAGVERQNNENQALAKARGVPVSYTLTDNDISATNGKRRPGFEEVLRLVREGLIDTIVCWHTDRLYRLPRDLEPLIALAETHPLRFLTVTASEIDLNTPSGRMVARMLAAASAQEIEHKKERQRSANNARAAQGVRVGGRRPFGYEKDGVTIRTTEAEAIRDGYRALLSGASLGSIATDWNARGLTSGQGNPFKHYNVKQVLENPRTAGIMRFKGEILAVKGKWPAIVPEETWRAADALLKSPGRRRAPRGGRKLLTGIALCGVCEATVHAGGNARTGVSAYRCSAAMGHFARMAEPVEKYISALVVARLSRPDARTLLERDAPDVEAAREEANGIRVRLDALAVDFADGTLTSSQLRIATERLRERLTEVEATIADAGRVDTLGPLFGADDIEEAWEGLGVERQRQVITTLFEKVVLMPPGRGTRHFDPETVPTEWRV